MRMSAASSMMVRADQRLVRSCLPCSKVGQPESAVPTCWTHTPSHCNHCSSRRQDCSVAFTSTPHKPARPARHPGVSLAFGIRPKMWGRIHPLLPPPLPSPRVKQSPSLTFLEGTLTFEETASRPALLLQAASCSTFSASSTCCTTCTAHHTNRQKMSKEEFLSEDSDLVMSSL